MKQTKTQVAKELDISRIRLHALLRDGVITPEADGTIDITLARAEMKYKLSSIHGGKRTPAVISENFSEARTRKEVALADTREMEAALLRGELVDANDLRRDLAIVFTVCKSSLRSLPAKLAQETYHVALNSKTDREGVAAIFKLMLTEIDAVLTQLSQYRVAKK